MSRVKKYRKDLTPSFFGSQINVRIPEKEYPEVCFTYIHQNPVHAGLVKQPEEWEFSSYPDYSGIRNVKLINRERVVEFGLTFLVGVRLKVAPPLSF